MDFWWKLAAFLPPFLITFSMIASAALYVGESMPLPMVVDIQMNNDSVLYRPQYGNRDQQFKTLSVNTRRPEVLALGSSRILQFRAGFFNLNPDAFYNAAAPAWQLPQISGLLHGLDDAAMPRVLILAIDPPWFNDAYEGDTFPDPMPDFEYVLSVGNVVMQGGLKGFALRRGGVTMSSYVQRKEPGGSGGMALGLRAIRDGHGFRSDGSEQYGDFLVARWLKQADMRKQHLRWMRRGQEMYAYGDTVSEEALSELDDVLTFAAQHDITVIGYLPSFYPKLWRVMQTRGRHGYITALTPRLQSLFDSHGFPFFDFSDPATSRTSDNEFFDGWHASELSNLKVYLMMLEALPEILSPYSDHAALTQIMRNARSTWNVFRMDGTPQ